METLALEKWGGQEKLDAERAKRHKKRLDREKEKAGKSRSQDSHERESAPYQMLKEQASSRGLLHLHFFLVLFA